MRSGPDCLRGGDEVVRAHGPGQSVPGVVLSGVSVLLALINVYAALAGLLLIPFLYFVPRLGATWLSGLTPRRGPQFTVD